MLIPLFVCLELRSWSAHCQCLVDCSEVLTWTSYGIVETSSSSQKKGTFVGKCGSDVLLTSHVGRELMHKHDSGVSIITGIFTTLRKLYFLLSLLCDTEYAY